MENFDIPYIHIVYSGGDEFSTFLRISAFSPFSLILPRLCYISYVRSLYHHSMIVSVNVEIKSPILLILRSGFIFDLRNR